MLRSYRRALPILAILTLVSCNAPIFTGARYVSRLKKYHNGAEPNFSICHTYTIVPYSFITHSAPDPEERRILCSLLKELQNRGYRYSTDDHNLDFIATVRISNDVDPREYPHVTYLAPPIEKLAPYVPDDQDTIREGITLHRVAPRLELFIYDAKNFECAGQFVGAAIDSDVSYLISAEKMLPNLVQWRLPRNMDGHSWDTMVGNGMAGLDFEITTENGQDLYPKVYWIVPNSGAENSRLSIGDLIVKINGKSTRYLDRATIFGMMKGNVGRRLPITIQHVNATIEDTLVYGPRK